MYMSPSRSVLPHPPVAHVSLDFSSVCLFVCWFRALKNGSFHNEPLFFMNIISVDKQTCQSEFSYMKAKIPNLHFYVIFCHVNFPLFPLFFHFYAKLALNYIKTA